MEQFVLMRGKHHAFDPKEGRRRRFEKGEVLSLNHNQAKAFGDKFKPVSVVEAEAQVAAAQANAARELAAAHVKERNARTITGSDGGSAASATPSGNAPQAQTQSKATGNTPPPEASQQKEKQTT